MDARTRNCGCGSASWILLLWLIIGLVSAAAAQLQVDDSIQYSIFEEQPVNTSVGNLIIDSGLDTRFNTEELKELYFSILEHPDQLDESFYVDAVGDIRTSRPIDRESICPFEESCYIKLDFQVQPLQYFQIIKVSILLNDIDDKEPTFPDEVVYLFLPESSSPGTTLSIPLAVDEDSPKYGIQDYQLLTTSDKFELLDFTAEDEAEDLTIGLRESLDREDEDSYILTIASFDGGSPGHTGYVTVNITVSDINDNPPVFAKQRYFVNIPENFESDSSITRVRAVDEDDGVNGEVLYEFSRRTAELFGDLFAINVQTGEIFVTGSIDYEKASSYLLSVVAKDQSSSSLTAMATINIQVQDLNDNAPAIRVNILTGNESFVVISEALDEPQAVVHLSVRDPDEGTSGKFTCRLNNINFQLQQLYTTEFMIVAIGKFDREEAEEFNLEILCDDQGLPVRSTLTRIKVKIIDSNDSPPTFSQDHYLAYITENNNAGAFILKLEATDADKGENAEIAYDIAVPGSEFLSINTIDGTISASKSLDREATPEINVTVIVSDNGMPSLIGTALVTIFILDQDDSLPVYLENFSFEVSENQPIGALVGTAAATDPDGEQHQSPASYSIISTESIPFTMEPTSGDIHASQPLDREDVSLYTFAIIARTNGTASRAMVTVIVRDRNDNRPLILFPSDLNHTVALPSGAELGHTVTKITAVDADENENAELRYSMKDSDITEELFTIERTTGEIFLNGDTQEMKGSEIQLTVVVSDLGKPPLKTEARLSVFINGSIAGIPEMSSDDSGPGQTLVIAAACSCGLVAVIAAIVLVVLCRRHHRHKRQNKTKTRNLFGLRAHDNLGYSIEGSQHNKKPMPIAMSHDDKEQIPSYENWSEDYSKTVVKPETLKVIGPEDSYPPKSSSGFGHLDKDSDSGCSGDLSNGSNTVDSGRSSTQNNGDGNKSACKHHTRVVPLALWKEKIPEEEDQDSVKQPDDCSDWRTNSYVRSIQSAHNIGRSASYGQKPVFSLRASERQLATNHERGGIRQARSNCDVPYYLNLDDIQVRRELFSDRQERVMKTEREEIPAPLENWRVTKYSQSFHGGTIDRRRSYSRGFVPTQNIRETTLEFDNNVPLYSTASSLQDVNIPTSTFYQNSPRQLAEAAQHVRSFSYSGPNPYQENKLSRPPRRVIHEVHV